MHVKPTLHGVIVEDWEAEVAGEAVEGPVLEAEQGDELLGVGSVGVGRRSVSQRVGDVQQADVHAHSHLHARVEAGPVGAGNLHAASNI